ncbi:MAG: hypothetical protein K2L25_00750 [Alphaproteobacteria bacterium]|nr:hypothetical protein [Alphaproteobacteria bacterium]
MLQHYIPHDYNKTANDKIKAELQGWMMSWLADWTGSDKEVYFISLRQPLYKQTQNLHKARTELCRVMVEFEKKVCASRHWFNRKYWRFIGVGEWGGTAGFWHWHLLVKGKSSDDNYVRYLIEKATEHIRIKFKFDTHSFHVVGIDKTPDRVVSYMLKETRADERGHYDSERIVISEELFAHIFDKTHYFYNPGSSNPVCVIAKPVQNKSVVKESKPNKAPTTVRDKQEPRWKIIARYERERKKQEMIEYRKSPEYKAAKAARARELRKRRNLEKWKECR